MNRTGRWAAAAGAALALWLAAPRIGEPQGPPGCATDQEVHKRLAGRLEKVEFKETPLLQAFQAIADRAGVKLAVDWDELLNAPGDITGRTPITLRLADLPAGVVLGEVLDAAADRGEVLDFYVMDDAVRITSTKAAADVCYERLYAMPPLGGGDGTTKDALVGLVRSIILPQSWAPAGRARIEPRGDALAVTQSPAGHRLLDQLLAQLWGPGGSSPADQAIFEKLGKGIVDVRFSQIGLEQALDCFQGLERIGILVDWRALKAIGIHRQSATALQLHGVTLGGLLRATLTGAAGREGLLDFDVRDGVLRVSTAEKLAWQRTVRAYGAGELLGRQGATAAELVKVVQAMVQPDSWWPAGEAHAAVWGDELVVFQSGSAHREVAGLLAGLGKPGDWAVMAVLAKPLPELRFNQIGLVNCLSFLRDLTRTNFLVNWTAIEACGVGRQSEVTVREKDIPFEKALTMVLTSAAGREGLLDFACRDGTIVVSTAEELAGLQSAWVHDVADLLAGGGADGADRLIADIKAKVRPDSWRPKGGCEIARFADRLLVRQSWRGQSQVRAILDSLRAGQNCAGD